MTRENLSWSGWETRFSRVLTELELIFRPDIFLPGRGFSENLDRFSAFIAPSKVVIPTNFKNEAGIVGAAIEASEQMK